MELSKYSKGKTLLCVENSPYTFAVMEVLSNMLEDDAVFLAWDLSKLYRSDGTVYREVEDFFLKHLERVRECHLHDRTREGGHQVIGTGFVDFRHYLRLLSNYDVEYTIEVRPIENALRSLGALRKIINA